ncbi:MAG: DM13 domain-containing protein [Pseudomonadota bacterium]
MFINFKLRSALFAAATATILAACGAGQSDAPAAAAPDASSETVNVQPASAPAAGAVASGAFEGRSDHITTGGVSIVEENGRFVLVLADDFSLDGAPDPVVGFGNDGAYDPASQIAPLSAITGGQRYDLPASFDPAAFNEAYIWCEQFSVPLGVASLN